MSYQSFAEYVKQKKEKETAGESQQGSSGYLTFEQYARAKRHADATPEMKKKYYDGSGLTMLRSDFNSFYTSTHNYMNNSYRPNAPENSSYLKKINSWKENIQKEKEYFEEYSAYFSPEELAAYDAELDFYDEILSTYGSVLSSGASVAEAQKVQQDTYGPTYRPGVLRQLEGNAAPKGTDTMDKDLVLMGAGWNPLQYGLESFYESMKPLLAAGKTVEPEKISTYLQSVNALQEQIWETRQYLAANKNSFSPADYNKYTSFLDQQEGALKNIQKDMAGHATGMRKDPSFNWETIDVDGDGHADNIYAGGQERFERRNYEKQTVDQHAAYIEEAVGLIEGYMASVDEDGKSQGEQGARLTEAQVKDLWSEIEERLYYLMYSNEWNSGTYDSTAGNAWFDGKKNMDATFEGLVNKVYSAMELYGEKFPAKKGSEYQKRMASYLPADMPESAKGMMQEYEYQSSGATRENIPFQANSERYLSSLASGSKKETRRGDEASVENLATVTTYTLMAGYMANSEVTQEQYEEYMQMLDGFEQNGWIDAKDVQEFREQRQKNGLHANREGQQKAMQWYPDANAWTTVSGIEAGADAAVESIFIEAPGAAEQIVTRGAGYVLQGIGWMASVFGEGKGDGLKQTGRDLVDYESDDLTEAQQYKYNRSRMTGEATVKSGKFEKWMVENVPAMSQSITTMMAASVAGGMAASASNAATAAGSSAAASPLAAKTTSAMLYQKLAGIGSGLAAGGSFSSWAAQNAATLAMSGHAALQTYSEVEDTGMSPAETMIYSLASGAFEYVSEQLFGGNPILDDDSGILTRYIYSITENPVIRKVVSSKIVDWLGEGFEEVFASLGTIAMDYAMFGESDITLKSLGNDFLTGVFISSIMLGGDQAVRTLGWVSGKWNNRITKFDKSAQNDIDALFEQMTRYTVQYFGGDESIMKANGMSDAEIEKAKQEWEDIRRQFSRLYNELEQKRTDGAADNASNTDESAEGPGTLDVDNEAQGLPDWEKYERENAGKRFVRQERDDVVDQTDFFKDKRDELYFDARDFSDTEMQRETEKWEAIRNDESRDGKSREQAQYMLDALDMAQQAQIMAAEQEMQQHENIDGGFENGSNTEILNDGGQRNEGLGAGGQAGSVAESTARSKQRSEGKAEAAVLKDLGGNVPAQSAAEIGVKGGGEEQSLRVLRQSDIDQSARWKRIQEDAQADGARVIFFSGDLSVKNSAKDGFSKMEGIHQTDGNGNTVYYIKVDGLQRNAEMIYRHEKFHEIVSGDADLMATLMEALEKEYGKQEIAALVNSYVEAYAGIYGEFREGMPEWEETALIYQYMEEVFADAYADIKRGKYSTANARKILKSQTDAVQRAEQNKKATGQKTAPPEQKFFANEEMDEANEVFAIAKREQKRLDEIVSDIAQKMGLQYENGSQKSLQSIINKVRRKGYSAWEMKDHCRTKVELKSWDQIPEFIAELEKKKIPFAVEAVGPTQWGYQGLHITWKNKSGISNEVQLTTKATWETKLWSDRIYEKWRNVDVDVVSDEKYDEFLVDLKKSKQRWNQLSLPDFSIYASNSDAFSTRELYTSDAATGDTGRTSFPSISSKNLTSDSPVITSTLPVSDKKKSIAKPPSNSSIAQGSDGVKQKFSVEEDKAELDRQWRDTIAEDGLWSENPAEGARLLQEIAQGQKSAKKKIKDRAKKATVPQLKSEIKAAQKRIEDQKKILERAEEIGVTEKTLPEQIENRIRAARESLKIFRAELRSRLQPSEAGAQAKELRASIQEKGDIVRINKQLLRLLKENRMLTALQSEELLNSTEELQNEIREEKKQLKELQKTLREERKEARTKREEAEIKVQVAQQSREELVDEVLDLFHIPKGERYNTREILLEMADEITVKGYADSEMREKILRTLYARGEVLAEADEYYSDIRNFARHAKIYVPDSVRAEFGDDWNVFQKRAWGNQIYLTNNSNDMGIDTTTQELEDMFGGSFTQEDDLKTQLERILALSEEGKTEKITLAEMMRRNQNDYGWSVEEQMDELERKFDEALRRFSEKASIEIRTKQKGLRELMRQREDFRTMRERQAQARADSVLLQQVLKRAQKLQQYRNRATPSVQRLIDEQIGDLDTLARSFASGGLEDLQKLYEDYQKQIEELGREDFIENPEIRERLDRIGKKRLSDMDLQDVRNLGEALMGIIRQISNMNRMLAAERGEYISDWAGQAMKEIEEAKGSKNDGRLQRYILGHLDAKRFFGKISGWTEGGAWERLAQALSQGEEKKRQYQMRAMELFNPFLEDAENQKWLKKAAGEDADWVTVNTAGAQIIKGGTVTRVDSLRLTPMMKVALLMHSKNDDNLRHIGEWVKDGDIYTLTGGGMVIPNEKLYRKGKVREAYEKGDIVRIPPKTVRAIAASCTSQEKAFAALLTKYFDGMSKAAINEVSLVLDGWERASVKNYFPIQSDRAFIVTENELLKQDLSLKASPFLKERSHKGTNPIYLFDATDVLFRNIEQVSGYYGMAIPLRDLNAVLNSTYYTTSKAKSAAQLTAEQELLRQRRGPEGWGAVSYGSVKKALEAKWGGSAVEYINKLSKDLQGAGSKNGALSDFLTKIRGNYARAVISFNPSSVLKQMSSYAVSFPYLDAEDLVAGLATKWGKGAKRAVENLSKYSAVYWYRNEGNTQTEIREYMDRKGPIEKLPLGFKWTQMMDSLVTRRLLAACMHNVSKSMGLQPGSQESIENGTDRYWTEVAKLFNNVVLNTQSNTSIMERPELTRGDSGNIERFLTMFRTDAFQQHNMLVEAKGRLKAAKLAYDADPTKANKERLKRARKFAAKSVSGIFVGQLMVGLITSGLAWLLFKDKDYYDEEGEFHWEKFFLDVGLNVVEGYAGFIIGLDYIWSAIEAKVMDEKWYGPEVAPIENLTALADDAMAFFDAVRALDWVEGRKKFRALVKSAGMVLGIPVANIEKYLLAVTRYVAPEWAEKHENFWDELSKEDLRNRSPRLIEETIGVIMENRVDRLSDEDKAELARLYQAGGIGAVPSGIPNTISYTEDGEEIKVELTAKQREEYRDVWNDTVTGALHDLLKSEAYAKADDELKTEYIDKLYKYADEIAKHEIVPEKELEKWVQQGDTAEENGISLGEYVSFRVDLSNVNGLDENGDSVTGLRLKRCINLLEEMGWTDKQEKEIYLDVLADNADSVSEKEKKIQKLMADGMSREDAEIEAGMTKEEEVNALSAAGLSWDEINDIVVIPANKRKQRWTAIAAMNVSEKVKVDAMMLYANAKTQNLLQTALEYGVKMEWYMDVLNNAEDLDGSGSVSQDEYTEYIKGMDLSWQEKTYLWQAITDATEGERNPFLSGLAYMFYRDAHKNDPPEEDD